MFRKQEIFTVVAEIVDAFNISLSLEASVISFRTHKVGFFAVCYFKKNKW